MPTLAAQVGVDLALVGIVFSLVLFIVVFSAIVLYLAFRIKETFREGRGRGIVTAKVAFLVGVLFLSAAGFYFLALALSLGPPAAATGGPRLNLGVAYPSEVRRNARFNMSFSITNPGESIAHDATIQATELFQAFTVVSSSHPVTGNTISLGNVSKGTVIVRLELGAPDVPGSISGTITLVFAEAASPQSQGMTITVIGGP